MPEREDFQDLMDRELETMEMLLWGKAMRTGVELKVLIATRIRQGSTPEVIRQDLISDLEQSGRVFGEFRNAVKATAVGSVNRVRDAAQFSELGVITTYRWVAVLVETCPDCKALHGKVKKWDAWEKEGLPRTGQTVCREYCRCVLVPAETTALEPVRRERGR